jgi:hypothetical protein
MCDIGSRTPKDFLAHAMQRAVKRRGEDAGREGKEDEDPKRPGAQWRSWSTLAYATSYKTGKRYAGYSGTPGGMSHQSQDDGKKNVFMETDQAKRRLGRLSGIDPSFDPKKQGVPGLGGASSRPYCRCAEPAALSIAMSKGETVDQLVFAAFYSPKIEGKTADCVFSPCPNCSMWLNRFAGGYFTRKTDAEELKGTVENVLAQKHITSGRNVGRRQSGIFIINPPRKVNDISFDIDGTVYMLRCFRCAG